MPDPVTSALVLAGKGANELVTPKIRELLFGPIATAYGNHWGELAEAKLQQRRNEKRARNAHSHIQAVAMMDMRRPFEEVSDEPTFDEWLAGASAVDASLDPQLADFWRAALVALTNGEGSRVRLLRIVESLGPDDAVYLAAGRVRGETFLPARDLVEEHRYERRLEEVGIFKGAMSRIRRRPYVLIPALALPILTYSYLSVPYSVPLNPDISTSLALPLSLIMLLIGSAFIATQFLSPVRRLTNDGMRLLALLDRVRMGEVHSPIAGGGTEEMPLETS